MAPGAPTALTATRDGERQIELSWTAPSDDGGAAITGYRVEVSADGSAWTDLAADTGVTATAYSHTELRGEATWHYRVSAINSAGTGPLSNIAAGTTAPATVPGVPRELTATRDEERRIELSWTAPSDDGGAAITGYRVEVSADGLTWNDLAADTGAIVTTYSHTGLRGEATWHYRVSAINSAGAGPASDITTGITAPATAPGAPRELTATRDGERRIELSWTAPSDDGGAAITGYRVEVSADGLTWNDLAADTGAIVTTYSHTGLRGEATWHYRVSAINSAGAGPASNIAAGITSPATAPGAPRELTATRDGERRIELSWTAPSDDGGAAITGYRVEVSADGLTWNDLATDTGVTATAYSHTGLRVETTRHYRVSAINSAGAGPASDIATGITAPPAAPGAPTGLTVTRDGERRIELSWAGPSDDGGADITGYRVEVSADGLAWNDLAANTGVTATTYSHTGLRAEATWHYRVSAINSAGAGPLSNIAAGITAPATVPGAPTGLTASGNWEKWIDLSWAPPSDDSGAAITGYRIEVSRDGSRWSDLSADTGDSTTTYSHIGLKAEITRHYRVSATNSAGTGPASNIATGTTVLATPGDDRAILVALYNFTNGVNWINNKNWLSDSPIGDWYGVSTDPRGRVTVLSLQGNQLSGEIPPELGNLSYLEVLSLNDNRLSGEIPPKLGSLSYLETLHLSQNQLSGEIPPELGSLSYLETLGLSQNRLSGEIPPELGNLSYLWTLSLSQNRLSGDIPPELGNLSYVISLALSENILSGEIPPELGNLSSVASLFLWGNRLSGEIPPELGNLSYLRGLYLSQNRLSGEIPPELGNLSYLEALSLKDNQLTGAIPPQLGNLSFLESLSLDGNQLTGCVPWELRHTEDSGFLGLQFCSAPGEMPTDNKAVSDRTALVALYHATNGPNWKQDDGWLSEEPFDQWFGVTANRKSRVTGLQLDANWLSGEIPPELGNLSYLRFLSLSQNRLSGEIPPELGNLSYLQTLSLSQNRLNGKVPLELGNLRRLGRLDLAQNQLSGEIPPSVGNLYRLRFLELAQNRLSGKVPPELGNLSYLKYLSLYENRFRGEIPPQLGNLFLLEYLRLNNNRLSGKIPPQLGKLFKLERLNLEANVLTGKIPAELGNLFKLEWLFLNDNRFSGEIPPGLGKLAYLERLRLGGSNRLAGCIPGYLWHVPHSDLAEVGLPMCEGADDVEAEAPKTQLSAPPTSLSLDTYYGKYLDAGGIPIVASSLAPDEALFRVRDIINEMLSDRPELHADMSRLGVRVAIMARGSAVTNLPEFRKNSRYWDTRVEKGGLYTRGSMRLTVVGEENLLCQEANVYEGYDVFVHEFAHAVDHAEPLRGFRTRLESAYKDAMDAGLWPATYASKNPSEYWAQAVGIWFGLGKELDLDNRSELSAYDPAVTALIQQVFGDAEVSSSCNSFNSIQGTVTGPDGEPLEGVLIKATDVKSEKYGGVGISHYDVTAPDGRFHISVQDDSYFLFIVKEGCDIVGAYGPGGFTRSPNNGTPVQVDGADVTSIEIKLPDDLSELEVTRWCS